MNTSGWNSSSFLCTYNVQIQASVFAISCLPTTANERCEILMKQLGWKNSASPIKVGACWQLAQPSNKKPDSLSLQGALVMANLLARARTRRNTPNYTLSSPAPARALPLLPSPIISLRHKEKLIYIRSRVCLPRKAEAKLNSAQFVHFVHDSANCFTFRRSR